MRIKNGIVLFWAGLFLVSAPCFPQPAPSRQQQVAAHKLKAEGFLRDGTVSGGMQPRLTAALEAVRDGVRSVHIIDGGVTSALLLEVLTTSGIGTAVRSDSGPHFLADSKSYFAAAEP